MESGDENMGRVISNVIIFMSMIFIGYSYGFDLKLIPPIIIIMMSSYYLGFKDNVRKEV